MYSVTEVIYYKQKEPDYIYTRSRDCDTLPNSNNNNNDMNTAVKKSKNAFLPTQRVNINVGIMKINEKDGNLGIVRGSRQTVNVARNSHAGDVLAAAIEKHANHDQYFCSLETHILLYPDQKVVVTVPGSLNEFTVEGYRKALGKPFPKVDLYLVKFDDMGLEDSEDKENLHDTSAEFHSEKNFVNASSNDILEAKPSAASASTEFSAPRTNASTSPSCDLLLDELPRVLASPPTSSTPKSNDGKVLCPICNQKFSISYIQEHADICLESRQKNAYIVSDASDTDDNEEKTDLANSSIYHEDIGYSTRDDLKSKLLYIVSTKCSINDNEHLQLNIRRGHCFEEFRKYFSKK